MFALILESLGSTELLFILAIALIFFGPRKLPQLARSMGKGLAEFRRASDDFKRTWEREVALETTKLDDNSMLETDQSYSYETTQTSTELPKDAAEPLLASPDSELVVPRDSAVQETSDALPEVEAAPAEPVQLEPVRKQEWI